MLFGSDQVFSLIGEILTQDKGEAYDPLCKILYDDVGMLINKYCQGVQAADKEDLKQEVVWSVLRDMPRYYEKSASQTEIQRNAYLKTITRNACTDFFRKTKRSVLANAVDIDDVMLTASERDFPKRLEDRDAFLTALKGAFEINTTPDKMLAFVYNRLIGSMNGKNGSPLTIISTFDDVSLQVMYEHMVSDLSGILGVDIPDDVLKPLRDKVYGGAQDAVFHMDAHKIADSSKWIIDKVKEQNKNEY